MSSLGALSPLGKPHGGKGSGDGPTSLGILKPLKDGLSQILELDLTKSLGSLEAGEILKLLGEILDKVAKILCPHLNGLIVTRFEKASSLQIRIGLTKAQKACLRKIAKQLKKNPHKCPKVSKKCRATYIAQINALLGKSTVIHILLLKCSEIPCVKCGTTCEYNFIFSL